MDNFKIDKGIPIPELRTMYPFSKMGIGDSFTISHEGKSVANISGNVHSALNNAKKRGVVPKSYKVTVRKYKELSLHRVWRIK